MPALESHFPLDTFLKEADGYAQCIRSMLASNQDRICETFGNTTELIAVSPLDGDYHNGGRLPVKLTFSNKKEIVFKPRSASTTKYYIDFMSTFFPEDMGYVKKYNVIDIEGTTWENYISPAKGDVDGHQCSFLLGLQAFALYALRAIDIHLDNIVITEQGPLVIDTETILHQNYFSSDGHPFIGTLYETCLPPFAWLDEPPVPNTFCRQSFIEGLAYAFDLLSKKRDLMKEHLYYFGNIQSRFLVRSTCIYEKMIQNLFSSTSIDAFDYRVSCYKDYLKKITDSISVANSEITRMLSGDIPYFITSVSSNNMFDFFGDLVYTFPTTTQQLVSKRMEQLNSQWLKQQILYITELPMRTK